MERLYASNNYRPLDHASVYPLMMCQNDECITQVEIKIVFVDLGLCAIIALCQYIVYKVSMKQGEKVVITDEGV